MGSQIWEQINSLSKDKIFLFLSSANEVSTEPTCQKAGVSMNVFRSFVQVEILASGSGSGTCLFRTLSPAMQELGWAMAHSDS